MRQEEDRQSVLDLLVPERLDLGSRDLNESRATGVGAAEREQPWSEHETAQRHVLIDVTARRERAQQAMRRADMKTDGARDLGGAHRAPSVGKVLEDVEHLRDALDAARARRPRCRTGHAAPFSP